MNEACLCGEPAIENGKCDECNAIVRGEAKASSIFACIDCGSSAHRSQHNQIRCKECSRIRRTAVSRRRKKKLFRTGRCTRCTAVREDLSRTKCAACLNAEKLSARVKYRARLTAK